MFRPTRERLYAPLLLLLVTGVIVAGCVKKDAGRKINARKITPTDQVGNVMGEADP